MGCVQTSWQIAVCLLRFVWLTGLFWITSLDSKPALEYYLVLTVHHVIWIWGLLAWAKPCLLSRHNCRTEENSFRFFAANVPACKVARDITQEFGIRYRPVLPNKLWLIWANWVTTAPIPPTNHSSNNLWLIVTLECGHRIGGMDVLNCFHWKPNPVRCPVHSLTASEV